MSTPEPRRSARTQCARGGNLRKRKVALDVDLNAPPRENSEETAVNVQNSQPGQMAPQGHGGSSGTGGSAQGRGGGSGTGGSAQGRGGSSGAGGSVSIPPATIDLEAIDDEVVISSPTQFAEASKKNRRNHSRAPPSSSGQGATRMSLNEYIVRTRVPPNQTIIDCENYVDLESSNNGKREAAMQFIPPPPPPPKEPTFSCPVCMGPLVEEVSTKCGHIFCKKCIKAAITAQSKCPTCRRKLGMKDTIRIYLPTTN